MLYDQTPTDRIFLVTKSFLHHEMERGCKLSGVKKIRIHDLRHSHISHLIDLGFSAVAIADRVGHESIDITYRYSHLFPSKQVAMADRLDAVNASFFSSSLLICLISLYAADLEIPRICITSPTSKNFSFMPFHHLSIKICFGVSPYQFC